MTQWSDGSLNEPAYDYWLVSCATAGIGFSVVLRDDDAPPEGVSQRLDNKITEYLNLVDLYS